MECTQKSTGYWRRGATIGRRRCRLEQHHRQPRGPPAATACATAPASQVAGVALLQHAGKTGDDEEKDGKHLAVSHEPNPVGPPAGQRGWAWLGWQACGATRSLGAATAAAPLRVRHPHCRPPLHEHVLRTRLYHKPPRGSADGRQSTKGETGCCALHKSR